jgi:hypothetical protein
VTSGTCSTSTSAWRASAEVSVSVTPGFRRRPISSVPSLKGGRKVVGKNGTAAAATSTATPAAAMAAFGAVQHAPAETLR